jgi:hypothetical protein
MVKATIIKRSYEPFTFKPLPDQRETLEAADRDGLYSLFFREYDNRYKYCNNTSYNFDAAALREGYREWFSDVRNYANNGGDMW